MAGNTGERLAQTGGRRVARRFLRRRTAVIAVVWLGLVTMASASADLWVPPTLGSPVVQDTVTIGERMLQSPSIAHPFGTDALGRDVAARVVYGGRTSLTVALAAVAIMTLLGLVTGGTAGYKGGWWDAVLMRSADVIIAFPVTLFALVLIGLLGSGVRSVFVVIGLLGWPGMARLFRGSVLGAKEAEYVLAARAMGASWGRVVIAHVLPNAVGPVIAYATLGVGVAILAEAGLSFLGVGIPPDATSWGRMLKEAWELMGTAPWLALFPGLAVSSTVLALMVAGEGLRTVLDVKSPT